MRVVTHSGPMDLKLRAGLEVRVKKRIYSIVSTLLDFNTLWIGVFNNFGCCWKSG